MPLERVSQAFKDISMTFTRNPISNDMISLKNDRAISRSVRNIVLTIPGERPFDPDFGTDINSSLFELMSPITANIVKEQISYSIKRYEPRVELIEVIVEPIYDYNQYNVIINYKIIGIDVPSQSLNFILISNR